MRHLQQDKLTAESKQTLLLITFLIWVLRRATAFTSYNLEWRATQSATNSQTCISESEISGISLNDDYSDLLVKRLICHHIGSHIYIKSTLIPAPLTQLHENFFNKHFHVRNPANVAHLGYLNDVNLTTRTYEHLHGATDSERAFTSSSNQSLYWTMLAMATSAPFM